VPFRKDGCRSDILMIDLIIIACLLSSPERCHEDIITTDGTLMACQSSSIASVVRWQRSHPEWRVSRMECRLPNEKRDQMKMVSPQGVEPWTY
jgi:hypothetical protein